MKTSKNLKQASLNQSFVSLLVSLLFFIFVMNTSSFQSDLGLVHSSATDSSNVNILQWNCRNINTNIHFLTQLLHQSPSVYDIICLQSLAVKRSELPVIDGYYYPPYLSLEETNVRTAIYVKNNLQSSPLIPPVRQLSTACEIVLKDRSVLKVVNLYFPNSCQDCDLNWLQVMGEGKTVVLGDFNAHHQWWGGAETRADTAGRQLAEKVFDSNLCLMNDGSFTRVPDREDHNPTAIDLTLVSPLLFSDADWEVGDLMGSDHLPIRLSLGGVLPQENQHDEVKYNFSKADWAAFKQQLETAEYPTQSEDVSLWYEGLRQVVLQAADNSIPKKLTKKHAKHKANPWWNSLCKQKQTELRKAYHKYKKCQSEESYLDMRNKRIYFKRSVAEAKLNYWQTYVDENIQDYKDSGKLWKKVLKIKRRYNPPERPLVNNGVKTASLKEKANVLANAFAQNSQTESLAENIKEYRLNKEPEFLENGGNENPSLNAQFSMQELEDALKSIQHTQKATGKDLLSYQMIRQLPEKAKLELLRLYQFCWAHGTIPAVWKEATVMALPKQGKPPSNPSSYRPISLTPHSGKLYERIIKNRLEYFLEKNRIIPKLQAGFRKKRGCTDHIVKLTSHIKRALIRKRAVFATFFDIKAAYDSVWHALFLNKLRLLNITGNMYNFFKSFLSKRSFQVKVGCALSERKYVDMGLPQGSVISPLAFNIMLYDIESVKLKDSSMTLYADDLACWHSPDFRRLNRDLAKKRITATIQKNVDNIIKYMQNNGFQLAAEKTVFVIFTNNRYEENAYSIDVNGCRITPAQSVKYLGVVFDRTLTWKKHIEHLLSKTNSVWNLIKFIKKEPGLGHPQILINLVRALVRSRLSYGEEAFFSAAPSLLKRLESRETHFLKVALGISRHANPVLVYRESCLMPLQASRELRAAQYVLRAKTVDNSTSEELTPSYNDIASTVYLNRLSHTPTIARRGQPLYDFAKDIINSAGLDPDSIEKRSFIPTPIWLLERAQIIASIADCTKTDNPLKLATIAKEKIFLEFKDYLHVFTDGSKLDNGQVGCSFVIPSMSFVNKFRINNDTSIFTAEVFAIQQALAHLLSLPKQEKGIVILSDSKSALQALSRPDNKNRSSMINTCLQLIHNLKQNGYSVTLCWIPSHMNIMGNERADREAKRAAKLPDITNDIGISLSEAYSKLKQTSEAKLKAQFLELAHSKGWIDAENIGKGGFPKLRPSQYAIFYRLRTCALRSDIFPQRCLCNEDFDFHHIFSCPELQKHLKCTITKLVKLNKPLTPKILYKNNDREYPWGVVECFVRELASSPVSHLI